MNHSDLCMTAAQYREGMNPSDLCMTAKNREHDYKIMHNHNYDSKLGPNKQGFK